MRIYDIENDIKNLTSDLEELYFQIDDIFSKLEKLEVVINNFQLAPANNVEVNTDKVKPLANISSSILPQREDTAKDVNSTEEILKNSPDKLEGYFAVPKVVE